MSLLKACKCHWLLYHNENWSEKNLVPTDFSKPAQWALVVAQPYGGLSPDQMEGLITSYYEYHFLYVAGVKFVESRSIQGASIIKIQFQEGTVPPFITRFDAGSVPVGQLVFTSETRSLGEISDLALFRVRPMFSTLSGVSALPPFAGNQKTVVNQS